MNIRLCLRTFVAALALVVFSLSPLAVGGRHAAAGPDEALEAYKRGDFVSEARHLRFTDKVSRIFFSVGHLGGRFVCGL